MGVSHARWMRHRHETVCRVVSRCCQLLKSYENAMEWLPAAGGHFYLPATGGHSCPLASNDSLYLPATDGHSCLPATARHWRPLASGGC